MKQSRAGALTKLSSSALIEQEMRLSRKTSQDWMTIGLSL
jgi:hypothetical protein